MKRLNQINKKIILSQKDSKIFFDAVFNNPKEPNKELFEAFERYKNMILR